MSIYSRFLNIVRLAAHGSNRCKSCIRYADDIVLLAKSKRASERLLESSTKHLEEKLKDLSSRKFVQSIKPSLERIKVYVRGWLNYYGIVSMKNNIEDMNGWLYHRIRMCIWKQ